MDTAAVLVTELGVVTAAILAGIGWFVRSSITRAKMRNVQADDLHDSVSLLRETLMPLRQLVESHDRRIGTLSEAVAVMAATMERHERWHERNDPHPPAAGGH